MMEMVPPYVSNTTKSGQMPHLLLSRCTETGPAGCNSRQQVFVPMSSVYTTCLYTVHNDERANFTIDGQKWYSGSGGKIKKRSQCVERITIKCVKSQPLMPNTHLDGIVPKATDDLVVIVLETVNPFTVFWATLNPLQVVSATPPICLNSLEKRGTNH